MEPFRGSARYQIVRELGAGGMGVVYEAIDRERGDRRVALKVLQGQDAASLSRLKREFRTLHDVRHPNLVALYELTAEGDTWFFTLELVDGVDFFTWVRPGGAVVPRSQLPTAELDRTVRSPTPVLEPLQLERVRDGFRQLAEGVAFLHSKERLHRDLKPSNVLVTKAGRVVILDFGLVAELGGPASLTEEQGQAIVGTVAYMAPEQAASGPIGPKSDWYAVGVMLFQALTGRLPFEGPAVEVMLDKQRRPPPDPRELNEAVPEPLAMLCTRLMARIPGERPEPDEILRALGGAPVQHTAPLVTLSGRARELERLEQAFERTRTGGPRVVRVQGASGIGKTALLRAFEKRAEAQGAVVLMGRCHERETVPFKAMDPLIDALTRYLGTLPAERVDALRPRDAALLGKMFPVLLRLPAFRDAPLREVAEPLERRRRSVLALRELFERLGERVPLVVMVDDAQWGDVDSVGLMEALLRPPEPPTVLVITSIRDDGPALPAGTVPVEVLEVRPLDGDVCETIAAQSGVDSARAKALATACQGNPLLLVQLLESSGEGELSVEGLWRRKLATLEPGARRMLEVICQATVPIDAMSALEVAGVDRGQLDLVPVLEGKHLIRLLPDERRVEPWREGLRATVLAEVSASRSVEVHARLATALARAPDAEPESVAFHFAAAGLSDEAADATLQAAHRAREQLAFGRAASMYRRVLELLPRDDRRRFELSVLLGECLANAGQGKAAADVYRAASSEPGATPKEREPLKRLAAEQLLVSGHVDEGVTAMAEVLRDLGMTLAKTPGRAVAALAFRRLHVGLRGLSFDERPAEEVDAILLQRIDACWSVSVGLGMVDTIRGASFQTRQLLLALDAGEPTRVSRALAAEAAFVATEGRSRERRARELLTRARAICERVGDVRLKGLVAFCEGLTRFLVGDFREARVKVAEAEGVLREAGLGVSWEAASARLFSVWSLFYLGELSELARRVPSLLREAQSRGDRYASTSLTVGLATVARLAAGEPGAARTAVADAMAAWPSTTFHFQHYWALLSDGLIGLYEGQPGPALARLMEAWPRIERAMLLRIQNVRIEALSLKARLAVAAGDERVAREAVRSLSGEHVSWARAQALTIEAAMAPTRAAESLAEAVTLFDQQGMRLFAAATRLRLGGLQAAELGAANVRAATAWFETQDVKDPLAFARVLVPGSR